MVNQAIVLLTGALALGAHAKPLSFHQRRQLWTPTGPTPSNQTVPVTVSASFSQEDVFNKYTGDGSAGAGWPTVSDWIDYDTMFERNSAVMGQNCYSATGPQPQSNSPDENALIKKYILEVAAAASGGVDPRFVLASIMQESQGCVRAPTTRWAHANPGLMQTYMGTGSCNDPSVGGELVPCPEANIKLMIEEGVLGVDQGSGARAGGIVQRLAEVGGEPTGQNYYFAARHYNTGNVNQQDLNCPNAGTPCYAMDMANRLTGWVTGAHACDLPPIEQQTCGGGFIPPTRV